MRKYDFFGEAERYVYYEDDRGKVHLRMIHDKAVIYKSISIEEAKSLRDWLTKIIEEKEEA